MDLKTYSECIELPSFEERYRYLRLTGVVGEQTFAHQRHLNQTFYTSREWRDLRNHIIARDFGRDLACEGYEIFDAVYIRDLREPPTNRRHHRSAQPRRTRSGVRSTRPSKQERRVTRLTLERPRSQKTAGPLWLEARMKASVKQH